ncbi:hypothetical protein AVEN_128498-1, partial [Araneus ventricosus]
VRDRTGARIVFPNKNDDDENTITIIGRKEEVKAAKAELNSIIEQLSEVVLHGIFPTVTPVVTTVLAAVRTLDRFGISDPAGAAIVSAALQDVGIFSESNVLNVVDRNKIRRGRTKARTTLLSQVIKDYDHDQFGLYFDGRKDRTLSMEDNRRKAIIEEHISLVKRTRL